MKVHIDAHNAAHFILDPDYSVFFIKRIINAPIRGKKIVKVTIGQLIILKINKPR